MPAKETCKCPQVVSRRPILTTCASPENSSITSYDFLSRQLEAARIDEAKNAVLVQTVDRAVEPEEKSGPRRMLIVAVTALLALVLVCFVTLMREAVRRKQQDPVEAERLAQLNRYLRSPL